MTRKGRLPPENRRMSDVQFWVIEILMNGIRCEIPEFKSTEVNEWVNKKRRKQKKNEVHPNNFRASCETLVERGLLMRVKRNLDWYLSITPAGIDEYFNYLESKEEKA